MKGIITLALLGFSFSVAAQNAPQSQWPGTPETKLPQPDFRDSYLYLDSWQRVASGQSGTDWYVKGRDLRHGKGDYRTVWVKQDHSRDKSVTARESKIQITVGCKSHTYTTLSFIEYDAAGRVLQSGNFPSYQVRYDPIAPDTVAESFAKAVCDEAWSD